jgi:hypothetical protein
MRTHAFIPDRDGNCVRRGASDRACGKKKHDEMHRVYPCRQHDCYIQFYSIEQRMRHEEGRHGVTPRKLYA